MDCFVCHSPIEYYFSKDFYEYGIDPIVNYYRCPNCSLVQAKELLEMPFQKWKKLNQDFCFSLWLESSTLDKKWTDRISKQVDDIRKLHKLNLIDASFFLDYGCGDGYLIKQVPELYPTGYDRYVSPYRENARVIMDGLKYDLVVNTSFFEHVRHRDEIELINDLVADDGVLAFHTLICEEVPKDPDWFYFWPVHNIFYTNKSMQILFDQWEYKCSIYNPISRMWFWFRRDIDKEKLPESFIYKKGFVDYWK